MKIASVLLFLSIAVASCIPGVAQLVAPSPTIVYAPTIAPPSITPGPSPTLDPRTPTMVPPDAAQATIAARATASPFPTPRIETRLSGYPAAAGVERDGLRLVVDLSRNTFLAGEGAQASVVIRNDGPSKLFIDGGGDYAAQLILLDEQGQEPAPWPWPPVSHPGMTYLNAIAPGEALTTTIPFQVPPIDQAASHSYAVWAVTRFSRSAPENNNGPDNLWLRLEAGPIPLLINEPTASQHMAASLLTDQKGWKLRVRDAAGNVPTHPLSGVLEAASDGGYMASPLNDNPQGEWSGARDDNMTGGNRVVVRAHISAPGYVTAAITGTMPGSGSPRTVFDVQTPPVQVFSSLSSAQAAVNLPLVQPKQLPPGASLERVEVEDIRYDGNRHVNVTQSYRFGVSNWLELEQMNSTEQYSSAGWGRARYDEEAQQVTVSGSTGYLVQQLGWWILDWKIGAVGFELRAPVGGMWRDDVLQIANRVQP